mmetsp:Transcript_19148/g.32904  ORF Transcript_19148/g.32904 Transcript_19148/m.32904 type:complete len:333 (+) Transcript_19148:316-1314(+)
MSVPMLPETPFDTLLWSVFIELHLFLEPGRLQRDVDVRPNVARHDLGWKPSGFDFPFELWYGPVDSDKGRQQAEVLSREVEERDEEPWLGGSHELQGLVCALHQRVVAEDGQARPDHRTDDDVDVVRQRVENLPGPVVVRLVEHGELLTGAADQVAVLTFLPRRPDESSSGGEDFERPGDRTLSCFQSRDVFEAELSANVVGAWASDDRDILWKRLQRRLVAVVGQFLRYQDQVGGLAPTGQGVRQGVLLHETLLAAEEPVLAGEREVAFEERVNVHAKPIHIDDEAVDLQEPNGHLGLLRSRTGNLTGRRRLRLRRCGRYARDGSAKSPAR